MSLILSGTDGLSDVDGSAATPAIRGTDANTGIFFPAADTIAFAEGGAEVARFDSSGNLGLGVTPSAWDSSLFKAFEIPAGSFNAYQTSQINLTQNAYFTTAPTYWAYKNTAASSLYRQTGGIHSWHNAPSGTAGNAITFTQAMTLDASGNLLVGGTSTSALDGVFGAVIGGSSKSSAGVALETSTSQWMTYTDSNQAMIFYDARLNAERARIDSSGNFIIGQTATPLAGDGQFFNSTGRWTTRQGSGGIYAQFLNSSGTEIGRISNNSNAATVFSTTSDYRLKEEVTPMTGALAKIAALKPVSYKWKSTGDVSQGFIAHELQAVIPDAVVGEKDAIDENGQPQYQSIDTSFLVATLTAALQELDAKFEAYKATHP
jgi:hypothetical protein